MIDLARLRPDSKSVTLRFMATAINIPIPYVPITPMDDLTCTISYISPKGFIQPVFADLCNERSWTDIMTEAIACDAVTVAGLYLATALDPDTKHTTLDCVFTVEGETPTLTFKEGIHLTTSANVTRWPPKKKTN